LVAPSKRKSFMLYQLLTRVGILFTQNDGLETTMNILNRLIDISEQNLPSEW